MEIFISTNETGHCVGWGTSPIDEKDIRIDIDEDHDFLTRYGLYIYVNDRLVLDEDQEEKIKAEQEFKSREQILLEENENLKTIISDMDKRLRRVEKEVV